MQRNRRVEWMERYLLMAFRELTHSYRFDVNLAWFMDIFANNELIGKIHIAKIHVNR